MGHVNCDALAIPNEILRNFSAEFCAVNIPVNAPDWLEGLEPIQNLDRPEVARMPNLVAFGEMPGNRVVEKSVGVGEQPDSQFPAYARLQIFRQVPRRSSEEAKWDRATMTCRKCKVTMKELKGHIFHGKRKWQCPQMPED